MPRKLLKYNTDQFKKEFTELKNSDVEIYFDVENEKVYQQIVGVLKQAGPKRVKTIVAVILRNEYYNHIYKIEDKNVTAIKVKAGKSKKENFRIYCKEIFVQGKKVVLVTSHIKKVQKNKEDKTIINIIKAIKTYDYEF